MMEHGEDADKRKYIVVKNAEDQFSIWFDGRALPSGWVAVGKSGSKEECLSYIKEVWTDMRPASLRRYMESRPE